GATFADAAAGYLRYIEHDRGRKPSTVRGYRSAIEAHLLPMFGSKPVESVLGMVLTMLHVARRAPTGRSRRGEGLAFGHAPELQTSAAHVILGTSWPALTSSLI
ncbi:MAG: integrase, partial [Thermoleophilaceae bacterium]|nr:integrase [Thermoleophilaceae bacterium]